MIKKFYEIFNEILDQFNPKSNSAVEGYFISNNTFKVTSSYDSAIKVGSENKVFEYGPFGSSCEMYEMGTSADKTLIGAKVNRLLILNKSRSKNGKLVTEIFHGEGVSISNLKTVTFDHYISIEKAPYSQLKRFTASLGAVRNRLLQKIATVKWESKLIK